MADASVGIRVDYSQLQAAQKSAENLKSDLRELAREKVSLAGDFRDALTEAERLRAVVKDLNNTIKAAEKGGGKAQADDYIKQAAAVKDLAKAEENLRSIRADQRTNQSLIDIGKQELAEAKERVKVEQELAAAMDKRRQSAMEAENSSLQRMREEIALAQQLAQTKREAEAAAAAQKARDEAAAATQKARDEGRIVSVNLEEQAEAAKKAQEAQEALRKAEAEEQAQLAQSQRDAETDRLNQQAEAAERVRTVLQGISSVMSAGASVSNFLGDFASGVGDSFSGMAQMFGNNNVSTAITRFLTYNALRGITNNVSGIVSRYDIMSTFLPYMEVAGVGNDAAQVALDRVNQAILGLPIGLDESAQRLRRYQMFLGNVDDATNLTIGAQNAILAGGASDQMKNMAYMQIDRLLAAGRLNTARQWLSLIQGLGVSMRFISEQMGVAGMDVRDLAAGLASGAIDARDFLNALMELGKGESDAAQGLQATLDIYKGTIEAWINNIQFAATRGGENIMKALNQTLVDATGQGITGYMKNYRDFLNQAFGKPGEGGIAGWITSNPDAIISVMGKAYDLIEVASRFSASDAGGMILENTGRLFDAVATGLNAIPSGKLEEFVAFATTLAGPLGAAFGASSGLGQMLGIFERFKDFDFSMLISDISDAVGEMANLVNSILSIVDDETMSKLLAYGLVFGKPVGNILSTGAGAFSSLASLSLLRKIANGGVAAGAATAAAGASGNAVLGSWALTNNPLSWGLANALPGIGAGALGGGILALLSSASNRNYQQWREILGYDQYSNGLQDVGSVIAAVRAASPVLPAFSREKAEEYKAIRQDNLTALYSAYDEQLELLMSLEDKRAYVDSSIKSLNDRMNRGDATLTTEDINSINAFEKNRDELDVQIAATRSKMRELNGEIANQGSELGKLTIKYGGYEIVLGDVETKLEEQSEFIPEYVQRMNDLAAATSTAVAAAKESLGSFEGFEGVEYPDTPKGGFTAQNTKGLEETAEATESITTSMNTITRYLNSLEPGDENAEALIGYVNEILALGDRGEQVKQLKEVVEGLGGENGIAASLQNALDAFSERSGNAEALDSALSGWESAVDRYTTKASEAYEASTKVSDAAVAIGEFKEKMMGFAEEAPEAVEQATGAVSSNMENMATKSKDSSDKTVNSAKDVTTGFKNETGPVTTASQAFGDGAAVGFTSLQGVAEATAGAVAEATAQIIANLQAAQAAVAELGSVGSGGTTGTTGGLAGSSVAIPSATGGPVFKAFGSDTVPYMLTPGEYIIRKGAADFFGRGLLERINALDIGGAFDRLILNSPVTAGRFGGNVYNKDNHASVVQNYYNSSPDYGNRRAWRFAHSL